MRFFVSSHEGVIFSGIYLAVDEAKTGIVTHNNLSMMQ